MSLETLQTILPLIFIGICCLVGEILVQDHRDRAGNEQVWTPHMRRARRKESPVRSHKLPL